MKLLNFYALKWSAFLPKWAGNGGAGGGISCSVGKGAAIGWICCGVLSGGKGFGAGCFTLGTNKGIECCWSPVAEVASVSRDTSTWRAALVKEDSSPKIDCETLNQVFFFLDCHSKTTMQNREKRQKIMSTIVTKWSLKPPSYETATPARSELMPAETINLEGVTDVKDFSADDDFDGWVVGF